MKSRLAHGLALATLVASLVLSGAPDAVADIGPPTQCPDGLANSYMEGRYCAPIECTKDDECGDEKCVERSVCLHPRDRGDDAGEHKYFEYVGECGTSPTCSDGTCMTKKVCTTKGGGPTTVDTPAGGKRGCGCSVPGGSVGAGLAAVGLAGGIALILRRRRARPR
jgi:MYXO-CTERM domain-containing protein